MGWSSTETASLLGDLFFPNPKNPRLDPDQKGRVLFQPVLRKVFGSSKRATGLRWFFGFLGVLIVCQDSTYRCSKMDPLTLMIPQETNFFPLSLDVFVGDSGWNQVINFHRRPPKGDFLQGLRVSLKVARKTIHLLRNAGIPRWDGWFRPYPYHRTIVYLPTLIP